jgi:hypothetical protein
MLLHKFQFISMNLFYIMDLAYLGAKTVDLIISSFTSTVLKISSLFHILSIYWTEILLFSIWFWSHTVKFLYLDDSRVNYFLCYWRYITVTMLVTLLLDSMLQNCLCFVDGFFSVFLKNTSSIYSVSPLICNIIFYLKVFSFFSL